MVLPQHGYVEKPYIKKKKAFFTFIILNRVCAHGFVSAVPTEARVLDPLELELQVVVCCLTRVQRIDRWFFVRAVSTLTTKPSHQMLFLF